MLFPSEATIGTIKNNTRSPVGRRLFRNGAQIAQQKVHIQSLASSGRTSKYPWEVTTNQPRQD